MVTVTKERIESIVAGVYFINAGEAFVASNMLPDKHYEELGLVTICMVILKNGFKVEGVSACVSPERYDKSLGEKYAYENAIEKVWQLEGYLLKQTLHEDKENQEMLAGFAAEGDCEGCKI